MKKVILFSFALLLAGCLQTKDHVIINKDCSGVVEEEIFLPEESLAFIDSTLGAMAKGFQEAMGGKNEKMPASIAEAMFGNKDEIQKKADAAGLHIVFINFAKERKKDGLHVNYSFKFDDLDKLVRSGIVGSKFELAKRTDGELSLTLTGNSEKEAESEAQKKQFQSWLENQNANGMTEATKPLLKALMNFKVALSFTMPGEIKRASGIFNIRDGKTAYFEIGGDILKDPSLLQKLYNSDQVSEIVSGGEGVYCKTHE